MAEELAAGRGFVSAVFGQGPLAVAARRDPRQLTSFLYSPYPHPIPLPGDSLTSCFPQPPYARPSYARPYTISGSRSDPPPLVGKERAGALVVWAYCLVIPWVGLVNEWYFLGRSA